jgi:hypothetical protein
LAFNVWRWEADSLGAAKRGKSGQFAYCAVKR